jgi:hypothetical protein
MKPTTLLRIAAILSLFQFIAHTALVVSAHPTHGPEEVALVAAMKSQRFHFALATAPRSYWDFYFGYGLFASFNCLVEAVLFWQFVGLARIAPSRVRSIVGLFCGANLVYAALVWRFFFLVPLAPDIAIALCLGGVVLALRDPKAALTEQPDISRLTAH